MADEDKTLAFPTIRPFKQEDFEQLKANCNQDGHKVFAPTHVAWKGKEIIGAASINAIPHVHIWTDTQRCRVRDTLTLLGQLESVVASHGAGEMIMPCTDDSPYWKYISALGFTPLWKTNLTYKKL